MLHSHSSKRLHVYCNPRCLRHGEVHLLSVQAAKTVLEGQAYFVLSLAQTSRVHCSYRAALKCMWLRSAHHGQPMRQKIIIKAGTTTAAATYLSWEWGGLYTCQEMSFHHDAMRKASGAACTSLQLLCAVNWCHQARTFHVCLC